MRAKEDIPTKFWREYESSDMLEREDKINHIVGMIDKLNDLKDAKVRKHALSTALRSYFDDLIDYMESKKRKR